VALKITILARQLRTSFDQAAEEHGLTRAKWSLIAVVARHPGVTQRIIAEALEVREITAGRLIDRLCKEGYLERREHPSDRRAYSVYLTSKAQPLLDTLDGLATQHEAKIFAGFSAEEIERLDALLEKISRNLSAARNLRVVQN
jgi:MarR family transcriptional regulator, transcriptional regulator for hemolysin